MGILPLQPDAHGDYIAPYHAPYYADDVDYGIPVICACCDDAEADCDCAECTHPTGDPYCEPCCKKAAAA